MMKEAIKIKGLDVDYGAFQLKKVDLVVPEGTIVGFVGENGSGKTTTLKSILGLVPEAKGTIEVFGKNIQKCGVDCKKKIGTVLDEGFFYEKLSCLQISSILELEYKYWDQSYFTHCLQNANISVDQPFGKLSKGMKMKVKLFSAMAAQPELLLLDEPTSGLDPVSRNDMLQEIQTFLDGGTRSVLFSSHITTDIEKIADYVVFIKNGTIQLSVDMDSFSNNFGLLKLSRQQTMDLGDFPFLYCRDTGYSTSFLIDRRQFFSKEYPDLVCEKATIDEVLLMIERGEGK